ncbi:MAG TPA: hypothetical protein VKB26_13795 [Candidatus Acidoferrales bacterium]|nr:hypothetical protein [Candidatus Acidoferrales bacterium]
MTRFTNCSLALSLLSFQFPSSNFSLLALSALLISIVFACVFHPTAKERVLAAVRYFLVLVIFSIALAWLMYPFSR